jgi:CBS domain-containing membrane protein
MTAIRFRIADFLCAFWPSPDTTSLREKVVSGLAGLVGIGLIMAVSAIFLAPRDLPWVVASMGASAVLLFAVPHGPLSQPWNFVGGHLISAFIGISVAKLVPATVPAAALAVGIAISVMYITRCLHPPGGATALSAVVGSPTVHALGYQYMVTPIFINVAVMLVWALVINNLLANRRYPEKLGRSAIGGQTPRKVVAGLGVVPEDLDYAMRELGEYIDLSVSDLRALIELTAAHAARRELGTILCRDIMTPNPASVHYDTPAEQAWRKMAELKVRALPVVDERHRVIGILTIADFLRQVKSPSDTRLADRMKEFLRPTQELTTHKPEYTGHLMTREPVMVREEQHVMDLFPIYLSEGVHHLPVVDQEGRLAGMVTPKDLLRALYGELLRCGAG